jgi:hypothetical protein
MRQHTCDAVIAICLIITLDAMHFTAANNHNMFSLRMGANQSHALEFLTSSSTQVTRVLFYARDKIVDGVHKTSIVCVRNVAQKCWFYGRRN